VVDYIAPSWTADADGVGPDDDTTPLPVILPDQPPPVSVVPDSFAAPDPRPQPVASPDTVGTSTAGERVRGPFEPVERAGSQRAASSPPSREEERSSGAAAKLNQIKDLYLTAEAIGDDALDRNFDVVSDRQRQLIREYFEQAVAAKAEGKTTG